MLCDSRIASSYFGNRSVIAKTRYGLQIPLVVEFAIGDKQPNSQSHRGQGLAVLALAGVGRSQRIIYGSEASHGTVSQLLDDVIANFSLEGEIYWDVISLAIYLAPERSWTNKFRQTFCFDDVMPDLCARDPRTGSCDGSHIFIALATVLRVDDRFQILSPQARSAVVDRLSSAVDVLVHHQSADGGWGAMAG
ncbi:MAG: hypothetical protein ACK5Q5_18075, partial [Planctomycetaceae bacterium]